MLLLAYINIYILLCFNSNIFQGSFMAAALSNYSDPDSVPYETCVRVRFLQIHLPACIEVFTKGNRGNASEISTRIWAIRQHYHVYRG